MGDHAASVAKAAIKLAPEPPLEHYVHLPEMAERSAVLVHGVLRALVESDAIKAREIAVEDDEIDRLYHATFDEVVELMRQDPANVERGHPDHHRLALPRADRRPGDEHRRGRRLPRDRGRRRPQPVTRAVRLARRYASRVVTELHFLRHAHAGDPLAWQGRDEDRPLSDKGERQAERLGVFLAGVRFSPDVFITSPKVRAARTAEIVAGHLGINGHGRRPARQPGSTSRPSSGSCVDAGGPARPVIVGHDPDFSELLALLSGASDLPMRKGAFALVDAERPLAAGAGTLRWLVPPDLLKPER